MTRRRGSARSFILAALLAFGGCGDVYDDIVHDNTPLCRPTATRECHCNDGAPGVQACLAAGDDYGACDCSPDAGISEVDADVDAPDIDAAVDTSIDAP